MPRRLPGPSDILSDNAHKSETRSYVCGWCQTLSHKDECPAPGISPGAECPLPLSPQLGLTAVLSSVHSLRVSDSLIPHVCSTPGLPVLHQLLERAQNHVHHVGDAIQLSHPLSSPSPPAFNLSQHQGLFQQTSSSHQVAKDLEFQLQHQSFQCIFRADFLWD